MDPRTRRSARGLLGGLAAGLACCLVLLPGRVAHAHGDEGEMTVTVAEPSAAAISVEVGILYANDGDLAQDATVEATATGPAGQIVGPVPLLRVEGARYAGVIAVDAPGEWTVSITAVEPTAAATAVVAVPEPPAPETSGPPPETAVPEPAPSTAPPVTAGPATTEPVLIAPAPPLPAETVGSAAGDTSGSNAPLVAGAVVVLVAGTAAVVWFRTRRSAGS